MFKNYFSFMNTGEISWKEIKQLSHFYWKQFINPITRVPAHIYLLKYFLSFAEYFITSIPAYAYLFQDGVGILCPVKIVLILTIIMLYHIFQNRKSSKF